MGCLSISSFPFKRFQKPFQSRPASAPRVATGAGSPPCSPSIKATVLVQTSVVLKKRATLRCRAVSLDEDFQSAQTRVKQLAQTPPPDRLLELYSLYKQATEGDVTGSRPGMLDFKGRAKYDAWAGRKGTSKEAAKQSYVELVKRLVEG